MKTFGLDPIADVVRARGKLADQLDQLIQLVIVLRNLKQTAPTPTPFCWGTIDEISSALRSNIEYTLGENASFPLFAIEAIKSHMRNKELRLENLLQTTGSIYVGTANDSSNFVASIHETLMTPPLPLGVPRSIPCTFEDEGLQGQQSLTKSGSTDLGFTYPYDAERQPEIANSNLQAQFDTEPPSATSQESFPSPTASPSEHTPNAKKVRKRGGPHRCDLCPKTFTRGTTLREHARTHTDDRPYKCSSCKKIFVRLKDCRRHERLHSNAIEVHCGGKWYGCRGSLPDVSCLSWGCGRQFTRLDALKAHLSSSKAADCLHNPVEREKARILRAASRDGISCECVTGDKIWGCGQPFQTLDSLKAHLELNERILGHLPYLDKQQLDCVMIEVSRLPYPCLKIDGGCGRRFGNAIDLEAHLNVPFKSHCLRPGIISEAMEKQKWKRNKE